MGVSCGIISFRFQNTGVSRHTGVLCGLIGRPLSHDSYATVVRCLGHPHLCFFPEMTLRFCVGHAVFLPTALVVVGFGSQLLV
jgi:hypothetical protein